MPTRRRRAPKGTLNTSIEGLQDFLKDMGVIPREMKRAEEVFQTLAASTVLVSAKQYATIEGPQQTLAATTLKQMGSGVVQYGPLPFAMGAEFGSILYGQFPEWRGNKEDAGYFFWPAIRHFRNEDMVNLWVREVWEVVADLFSG